MSQTRPHALTALLTGVTVLVAGIGLLAPKRGSGHEDNAKASVKLQRVPDRGIQPQVVVDAAGVVHLIYFKGDPANGDVFYVRSSDGGATFSRPVQVNSQPGSAIAIGNIRGAHLAVGKKGRVHVAWNGSGKALPKGPGRWGNPMLYARLNEDGTAFEPQQNVIRQAYVLDGGGSVAVAGDNVYVAWHAPEPGVKGESNRCVWVAHSTDEGKTFAAEKRAWAEPTGVCGCCGLRVFADSKGTVYLFYRAATESVHRDMYLLTSRDKGASFQGEKVHPWQKNDCPMSTALLIESPAGILAAWETKGQVYYAPVDAATGKTGRPIAAPGQGNERKHAAVAVNKAGETILVWTEGMGWERGGSLAWQVFDRSGNSTAERGRSPGVPTWSLVAVFARPDGGFIILY